MYYILYMDRNEREPIGLVMKSIGLGAISGILAIVGESLIGSLHPIFENNTNISFQDALIVAFVQVAPVEEFCKLLVIMIFIWKRPEFNEENDGIVYVGASALGFAMFENIFYVFQNGLGTGIMRAFTSMPLHCFTGVIMGYYTGIAKFSPNSISSRLYLFLGFFLATFIHGIYDTFAFNGMQTGLLIVPTVILNILLGVKLLKKGRELSIARWGNQGPPEIEMDLTPKPVGYGKWKIWISRPLIVLVLLLWAALIAAGLEDSSKWEDMIGGGGVLTFLPILVIVLLETSYRNNLKQIRS